MDIRGMNVRIKNNKTGKEYTGRCRGYNKDGFVIVTLTSADKFEVSLEYAPEYVIKAVAASGYLSA